MGDDDWTTVEWAAMAAQAEGREMSIMMSDGAAMRIARKVIESLRELREAPGHHYSAGEYSRRNIEAMVDDALA